MKSKYPELRKEAIKYQKRAYSPYSKIKVGAAVLTKGGVYGGCNVENISYGGTICAERTAILKAVSERHREVKRLYLYTNELWSPCGLCLQTMSEFMTPDSEVILGSKSNEEIHKLVDLMPKILSKEGYKKNKSKK